MTERLENIFDECLERMLRGESVEDCLRDYPEEAANLEPLLMTAIDTTRRAASLQPRPEFKAWARIRLEGAQIYARQQEQPKGGFFFAWQRGWAFALSAALILFVVGGAGTGRADE